MFASRSRSHGIVHELRPGEASRPEAALRKVQYQRQQGAVCYRDDRFLQVRQAILLDENYRADALILMSTPAGRLSLLSASIVLAVAWTISIKRL